MSLDEETIERIKHMSRYMNNEKIGVVFKLPPDIIQDVLDGQVKPQEKAIPKSQVIEKIRYVRHRTVAAMAPNGGSGKTTVLASLAINAAIHTQRPVAVVDFSETANLAHHLAIGQFAEDYIVPSPSLWEGFTPRKDQVFEELLISHPALENLYFLPGAPTLEAHRQMSEETCRQILHVLSTYFETIFVDLPVNPALLKDCVADIDFMLMICDSDRASLSGLYRIPFALDHYHLADKTMFILNNVGREGNLNRKEARRIVEQAISGIYIDAFLPHEASLVNADKVSYALNRPSGPFTAEVKVLLGKLNPNWKAEEKSGGGLFGRLKRK